MTTESQSAVASDVSVNDTARLGRRAWSLQARLIVAVIGVVALILVILALASSTILGRILQDNLDANLTKTFQQVSRPLLAPQFPPSAESTAQQVLTESPQPSGVVLVLKSASGTDGAYVAADGTVVALTETQLSQITDAASRPTLVTESIDGLGSYRLGQFQAGSSYIGVIGLPLTEVNTTIAQILTTVGLVTGGGLLLLSAIIALVIRRSLAPLRAVADTATRVANTPMSQGAVSITERVPSEQADDRTEIGRVGHALNTLLDHVDASLEERQRNEERMRRFVADASHELRTPLASIRGFSELSLRALRQAQTPGAAALGTGVVENTETSLERINAQSMRMTTLVEDLLLLARLDEGQELVYGSVDLSRLAIESVADARPAGPDHTWALELAEEPVVIAGDAARLHQVAANLLANARTHTPAGTEVTVTVAQDGSDAILRVHDNGPGVDDSIADEIFERFSRADRSRARKTGGTGLGLSICQAIVQAHGGTLSVTSIPGDTTFEMRLPARPKLPASS